MKSINLYEGMEDQNYLSSVFLSFYFSLPHCRSVCLSVCLFKAITVQLYCLLSLFNTVLFVCLFVPVSLYLSLSFTSPHYYITLLSVPMKFFYSNSPLIFRPFLTATTDKPWWSYDIGLIHFIGNLTLYYIVLYYTISYLYYTILS